MLVLLRDILTSVCLNKLLIFYYGAVTYKCWPCFVFVSFINLVLVGLFVMYLKV